MSNSEKTKKVLMYSIGNRIWHWAQALLIVMLLLTGFAMHFPESFAIFGFEWSVEAHRGLGILLVVIAALGLLYHLFSQKIRNFIPEPDDFITGAIKQMRYYLWGIFRGEQHPYQKTPEKKLNPIQKFTYLILLNVLLPLQILTGILMLGATQMPELFSYFGGLSVIAPIHTFLSYVFIAFLIVHIYMTTTGHRVFTLLIAMITGYEKMPVEEKNNDKKEETG